MPYSRSIELDPALMQAYRSRGSLLYALGRYEEASVDLNKALELAPDDTQILALRSISSWSQGLDDQALSEINQAIEVIPDYAEFYNVRALILAGIGEYDRALADIDKTIEINEGDLLPNIQDSRGYIYLKMGDLENAQADYEAILDQNLRFAYALLGAGVVYGRLGDEEKAAMLIDEAMEQLEEEGRSLKAPKSATGRAAGNGRGVFRRGGRLSGVILKSVPPLTTSRWSYCTAPRGATLSTGRFNVTHMIMAPTSERVTPITNRLVYPHLSMIWPPLMLTSAKLRPIAAETTP